MNRAISLHTKVVLIAVGILILLFALMEHHFSINADQASGESKREAKSRYIGQVIELLLQKHHAQGSSDALRSDLAVILTDQDVANLTIKLPREVIEVVRRTEGYFPNNLDEWTQEIMGPTHSVTASLNIGFWKESDETTSTRIKVLNGIIVVDLIVLAALVFHLLIKEIVTQPLWQFIEATRLVALGRFDLKLAVSGGSKEELILAESFNEMMHKLARSQEELRDANIFLEERVAERTQQIQLSNSFREAVIATVQEGIYAVDSRKRITTFNQGAERITGLKAADVLGKPCSQVMNYSFCQSHCILDRLHRGAASPGASEELVDEMQKKGRSWLVTGGLFDRQPASGEETFPGGVETIKDMTNTMRLQQQLRQFEKLSSMGTLTAGVAHELNNPLSNIKIYAQLLQESSQASAEVGSAVDNMSIRNIVEQANRASTIVKKMLDFSGGQQVAFEDLSIAELIQKSLDMVRYMMEKSGNEIRVQIAEDVPTVHGSRMGLQQVLINLFTNAQQAMGEEGGILQIEAHHEAATGTVLIRVSDTGPGIPAGIMDRIFDPFFTTKDVGRGTGLGLSISYGIIKDHGGELSAESVAGTGSSFLISLPARPPDTANATTRTT